MNWKDCQSMLLLLSTGKQTIVLVNYLQQKGLDPAFWQGRCRNNSLMWLKWTKIKKKCKADFKNIEYYYQKILCFTWDSQDYALLAN